MKLLEKLVFPAFVLALLALTPDAAQAQSCKRFPEQDKCNTGSDGDSGSGSGSSPPYYDWMHIDVQGAFDSSPTSFGGGSITGVGSHMIILDNFEGDLINGRLVGDEVQSMTHGQWTSLMSRLVAPGATSVDVKQPSGRRDRSNPISSYYSGSGLQVVNLSFGLLGRADTDIDDPNYSFGYTIWDSLVYEANRDDGAVLVKAAGNLWGQTVNDGQYAVQSLFGTVYYVDVLNQSLIGAPNALFVGALERNGDAGSPALIAEYSTIAGEEAAAQTLFVGVEADNTTGQQTEDLMNYGAACGTRDGTCLYGTSFAAPIVTGYAALLGQKHADYLSQPGVTDPAARVVDRLLETAITTTISGFGTAQGECMARNEVGECTLSNIYGVGEASLANALSPIAPPD